MEDTKVKDANLSDRIRKQTIPYFECSKCGRRLEEREFMAVIGKTPPAGLSMPVGRADEILKKVGRIYFEDCFMDL